MAVNVVFSRNNAGQPYQLTSYPEARHISISDLGHLIIGSDSSTSNRIAVFAPGQWQSAEVVKGDQQ